MKIFIYSLLAIVIGTVSLQFANIPQVNAQGWKQGIEAVSSARTGLPEAEARSVIINVVKWLLSLVFWLAVLAFVASGLIFIISFGNAGTHSIAKNWLMYAIIGLATSVLGYAIIISVSNILTGNFIGSRNVGGTGINFEINNGRIWGETNIPIGDNSDITVSDDGFFGNINLPW